jgi:O-methyltransferase
MPAPHQPYLDLLKQTLTASVYPESTGFVIRESRGETLRQPVAFARRAVKNRIVRALARKNVMLVKQQPFDQERRDLGLDWPMIGYTMTGLRRLDNLQECVERVLADGIPGDLAETGVWRGGSVIFMRALLRVHGVTDRTVWAADSFQGMPRPKSENDGLDLSQLAYLNVSLEEVQANVARFGQLDDQVRFIKGWFADTLPNAPIQRLALLRLDGDLYSSTMDALNALYHKLAPGGFVIVDDYHSWPSCHRAVSEFRAAHGITAPIQEIDGSGVFWRLGA